MATNIATYIKNLGKSVAFSTMDRIKEHTESSSSFVETNQELFNDIYTSVKDYKNTFKRMQSTIKGSKIYEAAEVGLDATIDSIKTGEFYSKKREDYITNKALGSMADFGGEFGDDGDWGDFGDGELADFNFDDDDLDISDGDRYLAEETDRSSMAAAGAISETITASAKYTAQSQRIGTNMLYSQSIITNNTLNAGFGQIHQSMQSIANAQLEAMKIADSNNQAFYNRSLELDKDRNEMLARILEIQQNAFGLNKQAKKDKEDLSFGGITDASGMVDLKKYAKVIKANLKDQAGMLGSMADMFGEDSNPFLTFAANPLQFIPNMIAAYLIPKSVETAMESFDKTVSGFFGSAMAKLSSMRKNEDDPIASMIGKIFGIRDTVKSTLDSSSYEKGTVPFDGITRKSIIEVIPFYLRQIAAGVTGQPEVVYDFKNGKFIPAKSLVGSYKDLKNSAVKSATSDIRSAVNKNLDNVNARFSSVEERDKFYNDMERFYEHVFDSQGNVKTKKNRADYANEIGMSEQNLRIFLDTIWPQIDRGTKMNLAGNTYRARQGLDTTMRDMEEKGDSVYNWLFNGSKDFSLAQYRDDGSIKPGSTKSILLTTLDDKGRNVFYYLQQMTRELMWQRESWGSGGSGSGGSLPGRNRNDYVSRLAGSKSIDDITIPVMKTDEEKRIADQKASDRERFNSKVEELMKKYPDGPVLSDMTADEINTYSALKSKMSIANAVERRKEFKEGKYEQISAWYDNLNPYGDSADGKQQWKEINEMVENTDGFFNQLKKAKSLKDKAAVVKINTTKGKNAFVDFIADSIGRADEALYKLIFGDDKEMKDDEPSFLAALTAKVEGTFERVNKWIDDQLDELKKKLGIESFGDLFQKVGEYFGLDPRGMIASGKERLKDFFTPIGEGIKEAANDAFDSVRDALDGIATDIGLNDKLQASFDKKEERKRKDEEAAKAAEREALLESAGVKGAPSLLDRSRSLVDNNKVTAALKGVDERRSTVDAYKMDKARYGSALNFINNQLSVPGTTAFKVKKGIMDHDAKRDTTDDIAHSLNIIPTAEEYEKFNKNARGTRYVEKAGLTAISEGELIIPANLNPFNPDRDKVNINDQLRNEQNIINAAKQGKIRRRAAGTGGVGRDGSGQTFFDKMLSFAAGTAGEIKNGLFGGNAKRDEDFERTVGEVKDAVSKHMPDIVGGGVVGGVLSLLTGMVGGPLLGAAAGAAVNVAARSDKLQTLLFGEMTVDAEGNETGERDGRGLISKEIQKYLPDLKKYGIAGTLAGFLTPLGPVGGLMVGASIAYAKNNERISEALFGEAGRPDSGLFSENRRKWIKDRLPAMAVGAAGTMLFGPFGLVGNAFVGAGLGLVSTTEEFKEVMFGPERMGPDGEPIRDGGIVGAIRVGVVDPLKEMAEDIRDKGLTWIETKIIDPVAKAIDPIGTQMSLMLRGMFDAITGHVNGMFTKVLGDPLDVFLRDSVIMPISRFVQGTVGKALKPAGWLASRPSAAIGAIGNSLRTRQVKRGTANYMTAEDRLAWRDRNNLGKDEFFERDQQLAGMDIDQLSDRITNIKLVQAKDRELEYKIAAEEASNKIVRTLSMTFDKKDRDRITKILRRTRSNTADREFAKVDKIIDANTNLTDVEKRELKQTIRKDWHKMTGEIVKRSASKEAKARLSEDLKKAGFNIDFNDKNSVTDTLRALDKERNARIIKGIDPEKDPEEKLADQVSVIDKHLLSIIPILEGIRVGDKSYNSDIAKQYNLSKHVNYKQSKAAKGYTQAVVEEAAKTEKTTVIPSNNGPVEYKRDKDGSLSPVHDPNNLEVVAKNEEDRNIQKGILGKLSGIGDSIGNFFKSFFVGNSETNQEPWWKDLLKKTAVVALGVTAFSGIANWLNDTFGIDKMYHKAAEAAAEKAEAAVENGGLGMSGMYGEESIGGALAGAATRLYARGGGRLAGALDNIPILKKSKALQTIAKGADKTRDLSVSLFKTTGKNILDKGKAEEIYKILASNAYTPAEVAAVIDNLPKELTDDLGEQLTRLAKEDPERFAKLYEKGSKSPKFSKLYKAIADKVGTVKGFIKSGANRIIGATDNILKSIASGDAYKSIMIGKASSKIGAEASEGIAKFGYKAVDVLSSPAAAGAKVGQKVASSAPVAKITSMLEGAFKFIKNRLPKGIEKGIKPFCKELGEKIGKSALVKGTGKAAGFLMSGGVLAAADVIGGFVSGYQEASSILGLVEGAPLDEEGKETVHIEDNMKVISGIIRALNNIVTLGLVPENFIVNLALKYFAPALGLDVSNINRMRDASVAFVQGENEAKGTDYSVAQYNMEVRGEKSIFKKMGDSALATSVGQTIKEGIIPAIKNAAGGAWDMVMAIGPGLLDLVGYTVNVFASSLRYVNKNDENDKKWADATAIDASDPLAPIKKLIFYAGRAVSLPFVVIGKLGLTVGKFVGKELSGLPQAMGALGKDIAAITDSAMTGGVGAIVKVWTTKPGEEKTDGLLGGVRTAARFGTRLLMSIPALMVTIGNVFTDYISPVVSGIGDAVGAGADTFWNVTKSFWSGDLAGAAKAATTVPGTEEEGPLGVVKNVGHMIGVVGSMALGTVAFPLTAIVGAIGGLNLVADAAGWISDKDKSRLEAARKAGGPIEAMKKLWDDENRMKENEGKGFGFGTVANGIWRLVNTPLVMISGVMNLISNGLDDMINGVKDKASSIGEKILGFFGLEGYFDVKETDKKKEEELNKLYPEAPKGKTRGGGVGRKEYYQKDPRYANVAYQVPGDTKRQTIGDSGCGPVAGANIISMITGSDVSVIDAARFATDNRFKKVDTGTDPKYFNALMDKYNVQSEYYKDPKQIRRVLAEGRPVILMGKDNLNSGGTPYGSHSHYVVATGVDKFGNIIIDDPENKQARKIYSTNKVLSMTSLGVSGRMKSLATPINKYGRFRGIGGAVNREYTKQDLGSYSEITAEEIDNFIRSVRPDSPFVGNGDAFVEAGRQSGLDPRYIVAHACLESGWGTSDIGRKKHNYFGIAAYDNSPSSAYSFGSTVRDGIIKGAKWISDHYYKKGYKTLAQMKAKGYATDVAWPIKIASIMRSINKISPNDAYKPIGSSYVNPETGVEGVSDAEGSEGSSSFFDQFTHHIANIGTALYGDLFTELSGIRASAGAAVEYGSIAAAEPSGSADNFFLGNMPGAQRTSEYHEPRKNKKNETYYHSGIDYGVKAGTPIYSPVDGTVTSNTPTNSSGGYGNLVVVTDANDHKHYFAHMKNQSSLKVGAVVKRGDQVGIVGSTGNSTGNHLHYEIRGTNGNIDPNQYFLENGLGKNTNVNNAPLLNPMQAYRTLEERKNANSKGGPNDEILLNLIKAIIEILTTIAGNTDKLSQIVELLTQVTGAKIDKSALKASQDNSKAVAQSLLKALGQNNGNQHTVIDKDNDARLMQTSKYLIDSMRAIASA